MQNDLSGFPMLLPVIVFFLSRESEGCRIFPSFFHIFHFLQGIPETIYREGENQAKRQEQKQPPSELISVTAAISPSPLFPPAAMRRSEFPQLCKPNQHAPVAHSAPPFCNQLFQPHAIKHICSHYIIVNFYSQSTFFLYATYSEPVLKLLRYV